MTFAQYCRLNVHVMASDREVIRRASRMLRNKFDRSQREARHAFYRSALETHERARGEYRAIVTASI